MVVRGRLPASLPENMGKRLVKCCEAGFAGVAPGFYRRAIEGTLKSRIQTAITDQICSNVSDPENRQLISFLLQGELTDAARKIERRIEIVDRAVPMIESATSEAEGYTRGSRPVARADGEGVGVAGR